MLALPPVWSSERETHTGECLSVGCDVAAPRYILRKGRFYSRGIKSHCFALAACGAAPSCSNLTLPLHTVPFSGGLTSWLIPLCGPLEKAPIPKTEEQRGSRKLRKLQVSPPSAFRGYVVVLCETTVCPCIASLFLPQALMRWGLLVLQAEGFAVTCRG